MKQPLDPQHVIDSVDSKTAEVLTNVLRRAYLETEQVIQSHSIFQSPHEPSIRGNIIHWATDYLINHSVVQGKLSGVSSWRKVENGGASYLEFFNNGKILTFSRVQNEWNLPRKSEFRLNNAYGNQLLLEGILAPESEQEEIPSLVLVHGGLRELAFARTMMLGSIDRDDQFVLARGKENWASIYKGDGIEDDAIEAIPEIEIAIKKELLSAFGNG